MVSFTVPGEPVGKGRPKFTRTGHAYTPEKTRYYEQVVQMAARLKMQRPFDGAVRIAICANYAIPKKTGKTARLKMIEGIMRPLKKPDVDNIAKIILDALNGIAYHDDKQVVEMHVAKFYNDTPGVIVFVDEIR